VRRRGNPLWLPSFVFSLVRAGTVACPYSLIHRCQFQCTFAQKHLCAEVRRFVGAQRAAPAGTVPRDAGCPYAFLRMPLV
jgi:hypothetical protein